MASPVLDVLSNKYCSQCDLHKSKEHIAVRDETLALNSKYLPKGTIRLLFVAESPPMAYAQDKSLYFYASGPMRYGTLSYHIMPILFEQKFLRKEDFLQEFMKQYYLIDMAKCPINKLVKNQREKTVKRCASYLNEELRALKFQKAVFVGKGSFGIIKNFLDLNFSHEVIPLPSGRTNKNVMEFRNSLERILKSVLVGAQ